MPMKSVVIDKWAVLEEVATADTAQAWLDMFREKLHDSFCSMLPRKLLVTM